MYFIIRLRHYKTMVTTYNTKEHQYAPSIASTTNIASNLEQFCTQGEHVIETVPPTPLHRTCITNITHKSIRSIPALLRRHVEIKRTEITRFGRHVFFEPLVQQSGCIHAIQVKIHLGPGFHRGIGRRPVTQTACFLLDRRAGLRSELLGLVRIVASQRVGGCVVHRAGAAVGLVAHGDLCGGGRVRTTGSSGKEHGDGVINGLKGHTRVLRARVAAGVEISREVVGREEIRVYHHLHRARGGLTSVFLRNWCTWRELEIVLEARGVSLRSGEITHKEACVVVLDLHLSGDRRSQDSWEVADGGNDVTLVHLGTLVVLVRRQVATHLLHQLPISALENGVVERSLVLASADATEAIHVQLSLDR